MIHLLLCAVCGVAFGQLLRFGQRIGTDLLGVIVINYGIASLVSGLVFLYHGLGPRQLFDGPVAGVALLNGTLYFVHLLLVLRAYQLVGVGIAAALVRAGIVVPALVAWFAWSEPMNGYRWLALCLVPVSMVLMRRPEPGRPRFSLRGDLVLLACFAMSGIILSIHKATEVHFTPDQREGYKTLLFSTATVASAIYAFAKRVRFRRREVALGAIVGVCNATVLLLILLGLAVLHATVFFPTLASIEICLNVIVARMLWQERLLNRQIIGLLLAIVIVLLTNAR